MKPNTIALIKLASSVYDMYPHETYAYRHNANNPKHKRRDILAVQEDDSSNSKLLNPVSCDKDTKIMPSSNGRNSMSKDIYPGQYNILNDRPNIEGTGHGQPLGRRPHNPQSYT